MKVTGERFVPGKMFKHSEIEHMHRYKCLLQVLSNKIVLDAYGGGTIAADRHGQGRFQPTEGLSKGESPSVFALLLQPQFGAF